MSDKEMKEGDHVAKIIKAELGEAYSGSERIELTIEGKDGARAIRYLYLTDRAKPYSHETLQSFGFDTTDPDYIDRIGSLAGRGCKVRLLKPVGKNTSPEVVSIWPLDEDRKRPSQEELKARIKRKHSRVASETDTQDDGWNEKEEVKAEKAKPPVTPQVRTARDLTPDERRDIQGMLDTLSQT